jgi:hypothetical protein
VFVALIEVLLLLLFFGGQSTIVLVATHQGINAAFDQHYASGDLRLQWQFRKTMYRVALACCLLMMVVEVVFYFCSK